MKVTDIRYLCCNFCWLSFHELNQKLHPLHWVRTCQFQLINLSQNSAFSLNFKPHILLEVLVYQSIWYTIWQSIIIVIYIFVPYSDLTSLFPPLDPHPFPLQMLGFLVRGSDLVWDSGNQLALRSHGGWLPKMGWISWFWLPIPQEFPKNH